MSAATALPRWDMSVCIPDWTLRCFSGDSKKPSRGWRISPPCSIVSGSIGSRFLFEQSVFARRRGRELSIDELNETMEEAQRETYGDSLDREHLHPYMWAAKLHYYSTGRPYYIFPYMFGLLFGLRL